ncbi:MAG: MoaD/ThiS family protein [Candidatus Bathyarchaeia archaeon]
MVLLVEGFGMKVKVKAMGILKKALGKEELFLHIDTLGEARLRDVIKKILEEASSLKDVLLDPELKDPSPNTIVLINGKEMGLLGGINAVIRDGDEIVLIPVVHGG